MKPSQIGLLGFKFAVTGGLLWFLIDKVDLGQVAAKLRAIQVSWAVAAVAALMSQLLLTGIRWYYVGQLVGAKINLRPALRLILIGQFFNQVLPSSIGGDGVRAWLASREGISGRRAVVSIICDRVVGLVVLTVIVAATLPLLIFVDGAHIPSIGMLAFIVSVVAVLGLLILFLLGEKLSDWLMKFRFSRPLGVLVRDLHIVLFTSMKSFWIIGLTLLVQPMVVLVVYLCARALNIELGITHALLLPLILLISMVPVSLAGWGVRESAMVVGLGFTGIAAPDALAISVTFGLTQIVVGLPGSVAVLTYGMTKAHVGCDTRNTDS